MITVMSHSNPLNKKSKATRRQKNLRTGLKQNWVYWIQERYVSKNPYLLLYFLIEFPFTKHPLISALTTFYSHSLSSQISLHRLAIHLCLAFVGLVPNFGNSGSPWAYDFHLDNHGFVEGKVVVWS